MTARSKASCPVQPNRLSSPAKPPVQSSQTACPVQPTRLSSPAKPPVQSSQPACPVQPNRLPSPAKPPVQSSQPACSANPAHQLCYPILSPKTNPITRPTKPKPNPIKIKKSLISYLPFCPTVQAGSRLTKIRLILAQTKKSASLSLLQLLAYGQLQQPPSDKASASSRPNDESAPPASCHPVIRPTQPLSRRKPASQNPSPYISYLS